MNNSNRELNNNRNRITVKTRLFPATPPMTGPGTRIICTTISSPKKLMVEIIEADVNDSIIYDRASTIIPFFVFLLAVNERLLSHVIFCFQHKWARIIFVLLIPKMLSPADVIFQLIKLKLEHVYPINM